MKNKYQKLEQKLDGFYENVASKFASTPFQAFCLIVFVAFNCFTGWIFINVISQAAITLTLLVLRGQAVGNGRMEKNLHQTKKDTKKDLVESKKLKKKIDKA